MNLRNEIFPQNKDTFKLLPPLIFAKIDVSPGIKIVNFTSSILVKAVGFLSSSRIIAIYFVCAVHFN